MKGTTTAIDVSWFLKDQIIRWDFSGNITIADIQAAEIKAYIMMQKSPSNSIHMILDLHSARCLPSILDAHKVKWVLPTYRKNAINVFVGLKNPMLNLALSASYKMSKANLKTVTDITEALQHLQKSDNSLPNLFLKLHLMTKSA